MLLLELERLLPGDLTGMAAGKESVWLVLLLLSPVDLPWRTVTKSGTLAGTSTLQGLTLLQSMDHTPSMHWLKDTPMTLFLSCM
jgi:hypothetical protein